MFIAGQLNDDVSLHGSEMSMFLSHCTSTECSSFKGQKAINMLLMGQSRCFKDVTIVSTVNEAADFV
jgi:hypothetical protein